MNFIERVHRFSLDQLGLDSQPMIDEPLPDDEKKSPPAEADISDIEEDSSK